MKKIQQLSDLAIQSLLIGWGILVVLSHPWPGQVTELLCVQFLLGVYQMSASVCSMVLMRPRSRGKKIHFVAAIVYLVSLAMLNTFYTDENVVHLYLIIPAWVLGIYYYGLSLNIPFGNNKRSKFLPNLGF